MFRKVNLVAALAAFLLLSSSAIAQTTVPLNTGYNHSIFGPYPTVTTPTSSVADNYWINIASAPNVPAGPAWVLQRASPWAVSFPLTNWIGARPTATSPAGTTPDNPAYTIFRKCFCLEPGYKDARLRFIARADDTIQVWLNGQTNQVLAPTWGNWNGTPLSASTDRGFRTGRNCIYALVEDFQGHMGFDLQGDVTAYGLLPMPAAGTAGTSFEPCACRQQPAGLPDRRSAMSDDDDQPVIQAIIKIAEARRAAKQRMQYQGQPPKLEDSPGRTDPIKRPSN